MPTLPVDSKTPVAFPSGMLPIPTAEQIKGLSAPELVVCLSYHPLANTHRSYYRDRLLFERHNVARFSWEEAATWWNSRSRVTRLWIARSVTAAREISAKQAKGRANELRRLMGLEALERLHSYSYLAATGSAAPGPRAGPAVKREPLPLDVKETARLLGIPPGAVAQRCRRGLIRTTKTKRPSGGYGLQIDFTSARESFHSQPHDRGSSFWRSVLWWNWSEALNDVMPYGRGILAAIVERSKELGQTVWGIIAPHWRRNRVNGNEWDPGGAGLVQTQLRCFAGSKKGSAPLTKGQRMLYGPWGSSVGVPATVEAGTPRKRRERWLADVRGFMDAGVRMYQAVGKLAKQWQSSSDDERMKLGGPKAWRKFRSFARARAAVYGSLRRAMWDRGIEGKPPVYARNLWFLLQAAKDVGVEALRGKPEDWPELHPK